ncbi:MAG TPA: glycosyltransferase family 4 protein, partial [Pyrinomonadaceae bacterium]|nr:glycosyltransferase family 4 protein [Pyrinomonadaceae bacterium]
MPKTPCLWIVSELYYPEMTSTGYYLTTIAEGLSADRVVRVICGQPNYANRDLTAPKHDEHNGVEIFRVVGTRLDKNRIVNRLVNMLTFGTSVFASCLRRLRHGDHVMVVTTPPLLPFFVGVAALLKGSAYTLLIHDAYPEQLIAVGALRSDSLPARVVDFLNRWLYKHASKIVVVGRDMKELFEKKTAGLDVPVIYIPNWAELDAVQPTDRHKNPLLEKLGLMYKFVVISAGNLGRPTDVETLVECADSMREDADIHFLFVGNGARMPWLREQVQKRGLTNITLAGAMPREEQNVFLNACDAAVITFVDGMLGAAVPSRLYNLLAAGKPVIAVVDESSEVAQVITEENAGRVVRANDPVELKAAILAMKDAPDELRKMGANARAAAETKYSAQLAIESY